MRASKLAGMARLRSPSYRRRAQQFAVDALLAAAAYALAFKLRFLDVPGGIPERYEDMLPGSIAFVAIGQAVVFELLGQHQKWWRYFRLPDLWPLVRAIAVAVGADGAGVCGRPALRRRPAPLGRGLRLPAADDDGRRRPPAAPLAGRAPGAGGVAAQGARRARGRRRIRRPDGRPRDAAQPQPGHAGDRLRRRRPAEAGNAEPGAEGAGDDRRDRRHPRPDQGRRGDHRDPLGARGAARQGRRRRS